LGIKAKDLRRSFENGLQGAKPQKSKSKSNLSSSKGSISNLLSRELGGPFGGPAPSAPLKEVSLQINVATLINGTNQFYTATAADKLRNAETVQSAAIDIDQPTQPLMSQTSNLK
jgi:hypothetical protein